MATVTVRAAGRASTSAHRKVTVKAGTEVLTLPITSPEVTHNSLTPDWQQIPRPGQRPLLRRGSESIRTMTFDVTFYAGGASVEKGLQILRRFATLPGPLAVSYGPTDSGSWQMTDLQIRSSQREYGTNNITQAVVSLTFSEWSFDGYQIPTAARPAPTSPAAKPTAAKAPAAAKPKVKTYTVRSGDTLSRIAASQYGNANRMKDIAAANHLKNPNLIKVGQRLVLP